MSTFLARHPGRCGSCRGQILPEVDMIGENQDGIVVHEDCYEDEAPPPDLPEQITYPQESA